MSKLYVYEKREEVPRRYNKDLRRMGTPDGELRNVFFEEWDEIYHIMIVVDDNDVPISWGIVIRGDRYSYKCAMFFTKKSHRKQGHAAAIFKEMEKRHKRFRVFKVSENIPFFSKMGRSKRINF